MGNLGSKHTHVEAYGKGLYQEFLGPKVKVGGVRRKGPNPLCS